MNQLAAGQKRDVCLPPGPKGSWLPTIKLIRNPRQAMETWVRRYGDPFLLNALNGPVVVTGREDLIREIHGQDPGIYETFAAQTITPVIGSGSMLTLTGERHRRERRMMTPMFQGERMKTYGVSMQKTALHQIQLHQKKESISTVDLMTDISMEVIIRTIFGGDNGAIAERMFAASKNLMSHASALIFFSKRTHISFFGLSPWDRWLDAKGELIRLLDEAIKQRQASSASQSHQDILAMLCKATYEDGQPMSREDIHAELLTFLFAGHETTALSMSWAIYHLHRNPETLSKLRSEIDGTKECSPEELSNAVYLKAVIQETLRLNPILTEVLRKLREPLALGDYLLPAGMGIAPATVLAHYNPQVYTDPDQFKPERFLERSFSPFEYMPFGGGHRRCIGAAFATYEMAVVLGTLLREYDFELLESSAVVSKRRSVTMGPSTNIPVRVKKR